MDDPLRNASKNKLLHHALKLLKDNPIIVLQTELDNYDDKKDEAIYFLTSDEHQQLLFSATAESIYCIRVGFGELLHPTLGMNMLCPISDKHDVMHLERTLYCVYCGVLLEYLEIYAPPERHFGSIKQKFNFFNAIFEVRNAENITILWIEGQNMKMDMFKILNKERDEVGTICRRSFKRFESSGLQDHEAYRLFHKGDEKEKLLLLGAAFLIERMYWETFSCLRKHVRQSNFFKDIL